MSDKTNVRIVPNGIHRGRWIEDCQLCTPPALPQEGQLRDALGVIRDMVPEGRLAHLTTSDQGLHGFVLDDITLQSGDRLSRVDAPLLDRVADEVWDQLSNLDWDGAVGEDDQGYAVVPLRDRWMGKV